MTHFALEQAPPDGHYCGMVSNVFRILGYLIGIAALYAMWIDLSSPDDASIVLGQFWFERHAVSLQISEAVISRYIDPCGLIVALDCEPFLWHPLIATLLGWPTTLVLFLVMMVFLGIAKLIGRGKSKRTRGQNLKRHGEK